MGLLPVMTMYLHKPLQRIHSIWRNLFEMKVPKALTVTKLDGIVACSIWALVYCWAY